MKLIQAVLIGSMVSFMCSISLYALPPGFLDGAVISAIDTPGIRAQAGAADEVGPEYPCSFQQGPEGIRDYPVTMGTSDHVLDHFRTIRSTEIGAPDPGDAGSLPGFSLDRDDLRWSHIHPGTPIRAPAAEPSNLLLINSGLISLAGMRGRTKA